MKFCSKCLQPDTRPNITFDELGVCPPCNYAQKINHINWSERRKELSKLAKKYGEDKKVAVRNIRRDIIDEFKRREKELGASKDQIHSVNEAIQKITDEFVKKFDEIIANKEKDLMKI